MAPSISLDESGVGDWLINIAETEEDVDIIFALIARDLYKMGKLCIAQLKETHQDHRNVDLWPSAFGGLGIISNRTTPDHRDVGGCYPWYDILVAAGNYNEAFLDIKDLGTRLTYNPGTVVAICGKLLRHGVKDWAGGERLCYAHYLRGNVAHRLHMDIPHWVKYQTYMGKMSAGFAQRCGAALFPKPKTSRQV
jgi:hypothetical protein